MSIKRRCAAGVGCNRRPRGTAQTHVWFVGGPAVLLSSWLLRCGCDAERTEHPTTQMCADQLALRSMSREHARAGQLHDAADRET